jgi:glycerol-3-phosphate dehydrogenase
MKPVKCLTHTTPLYGAEIGRFASFVDRARKKRPARLSDEILENLCRNYGSRYLDVIEGAKKKHLEKICESFPDIMAEVTYAVGAEMAVSLSDVLFRRTGLGTLGNPGDKTIEKVADVMGRDLKWNKARKNKEIEKALKVFEFSDK